MIHPDQELTLSVSAPDITGKSTKDNEHRNSQKLIAKHKNAQAKEAQRLKDFHELQQSLITIRGHSQVVTQLETSLASVIATFETATTAEQRSREIERLDFQTQIADLKNNTQIDRMTVLKLQEQLATTVQAQHDNSITNVSYKYGHLGRRYEILQGLYVSAESSYHTAVAHESIGETLRTMLELYQSDVGSNLIRFNGATISLLQKIKNEKHRKGKSEYTLALGNQHYLDCFETQLSGQCRASKSNSARHLVLKGGSEPARANCKLVRHAGECWLKLTRPVPPGGELLWLYGSGFKLNGRADDSDDEDCDAEAASEEEEDVEPEVKCKELTVKKQTKRKNHHWSRR
jgi:hypothetical protein